MNFVYLHNWPTVFDWTEPTFTRFGDANLLHKYELTTRIYTYMYSDNKGGNILLEYCLEYGLNIFKWRIEIYNSGVLIHLKS